MPFDLAEAMRVALERQREDAPFQADLNYLAEIGFIAKPVLSSTLGNVASVRLPDDEYVPLRSTEVSGELPSQKAISLEL